MSDEIRKYVIAAQNGDADAFGELYSIYKNEMYRYACIVVGDADGAMDAVSDAVLEAFSGIGNLRNADSFKGWLFKILNAACRRQYNSGNSALPLLTDSGETDSGGIDTAELSIDLERALSSLAPEDRQIVMMRAVTGLGSREIGESLGMSDTAVRSRYSRAIAKLGKILKEGGEDDG